MKERLTGAIILVALMVLLVPELLTGPVHPTSPRKAPADSSEEVPLRSYTIDLADDSRVRDAAAPSTQAGAVTPPAQGEAASANPPSIAEPGTDAPAHALQAAAPERSAQAPGAGGATPASRAPDAAPAEVMRAATVSSDAGPATASPEKSAMSATSAAPDKSRSVAKAATPAPASHPRPAAEGAAWVVQLGVFASRQNAEHLAQELREKGFRVQVAPSRGGSRRLFRVRTSPVGDRAAAADLAGRLRASGAAGAVVPAG